MNLPEKPLRKILPMLKVATRIAAHVPSRTDSWLQKIVKMLALFDAVNEVYGGGRSKMRELTSRYNLVERESATFVRMFFATSLRDMFTLRRQTLDEHQDLIEAVGSAGERIFFRESHGYSGTIIESDFYISPEVNFDKVIDQLWAQYKDGIYMSVTLEQGGWKKETTLCDVPPVPVERLSRAAKTRLKSLIDRHKNFQIDGVHRTYLYFGPRGTGKSSAAILFAQAFGGRALLLDATSLPLIGVKEFGFLLDTLKPGCLIIDDLDRAPLAEIGPRILFLLTRLKTHYPHMTVILSVNDTTKLDSALLRSGRIDIAVPFDAPEGDEIEQMVRALLLAHAVPEYRANSDVVKSIVGATEGLTHAYMDDLCRRLRHEELKDVLASVNLLNDLAEKSLASAALAAPVGTQVVGKANPG